MIRVAQDNAEEVGLGDLITFKQMQVKISQQKRIMATL